MTFGGQLNLMCARLAARRGLVRVAMAVSASILVTAGGLVLAPAAGAWGDYVSQFGSSGSGNGQFSSPAGVAVDQKTGDVYVADGNNNRVEKFSRAGAYISQFGASGTGNGQFDFPGGVAVDPKTGDVYVTDDVNDRVEKFSSGGVYISQFGGVGSGNGRFKTPVAVAVDPSTGDVYVV